mgnify:CR=1 FL=1
MKYWGGLGRCTRYFGVLVIKNSIFSRFEEINQ